MIKIKEFFKGWIWEFLIFLRLFQKYFFRKYLFRVFWGLEGVKDFFVLRMYRQRGKYSGLFIHAGLFLVMFLAIAIGPSLVVDSNQARMMVSSAVGNKIVFAQEKNLDFAANVNVAADAVLPLTQISEKPRADDETYTVKSGDTLAQIGEAYGVSVDSIKWANPELKSQKIKPGMKLTIPPVTGVEHMVKSGETIYSIAKKYSVDPQSIADFPFNTFTNDETFALAIGQKLVIPDGVMPDEPISSPIANNISRTPDAGSVTATGKWVWPTQGRITQPFRPWHKGLDIANHDGGPIVAADSGTVIVAGWVDNTGYGNRVVINHGNGYLTLYGHMSRIDVKVGQTVRRGDQLGMMGSTGRSTGTHLHFEIRTAKGNVDPLVALQ